MYSCVQVEQHLDEMLKGLRFAAGMFRRQKFLPVDPAPHELAVVELLGQQDARHRQQHRRLRAGPGGQPVIGHAGGIGEARVHHRQLRPLHLALDDALRLRVEIVAGLQVRADQQNKARVGVVGRGTVHAAPDVVAETRRGGADVGVAVVPIHAPRAQHALHVAVVSWAPDVVHHLVAAVFDNGGANFGGEGVQRLVPGRALPLALAALARALQGIEDALRVVDLVDGGRAFGAVAPAAAGMVRDCPRSFLTRPLSLST